MAYPAGPGFGSIQNISGPSTNPTAFPTAPPSVGSGGIAPGGLGNMVGVNLQQPTTMPQGSAAPQPFRAPLPLPPPPAGASTSPPTAAGNPFTNVQIPQGQNDAAYQPRGGVSPQQWQALSPAQRYAVQGPLGEVAAGVAMTPSDSFVASHNNPNGGPGAQGGSFLQGLGVNAFNQMVGRNGQPANSLFGLGG
jgi:hypothetical protein